MKRLPALAMAVAALVLGSGCADDGGSCDQGPPESSKIPGERRPVRIEPSKTLPTGPTTAELDAVLRGVTPMVTVPGRGAGFSPVT